MIGVRRLGLVAVVSAPLGLAAVEADGASSSRFTLRGTVTAVVDGDTVRVELVSGRVERVRLIGVDAPEPGHCFASKATAIARGLALGRRVTLNGDPTQDTRDRYRRLLAYVWLPGGKDLGFQMISRGGAKVYVFERPFQRLHRYRGAESRGRRVSPSVWTCRRTSPAPSPPPSARCEPSYPTLCLDPSTSDYDCAGGSGNGPRYVYETNFPVRPPDPFGLDHDDDGIGCEE